MAPATSFDEAPATTAGLMTGVQVSGDRLSEQFRLERVDTASYRGASQFDW